VHVVSQQAPRLSLDAACYFSIGARHLFDLGKERNRGDAENTPAFFVCEVKYLLVMVFILFSVVIQHRVCQSFLY
jgi:hypothetical protein